MEALFPYHPVNDGRIFFFLAALSCFGGTFLSARQTADAEVRAVQARVEIKEGSIVSTGVFVRNTSATKRRYQSTLELPAGWRAIMRDTPFELAPGESDTRLLSVAFSHETPAGTYQITYRLREVATPPRESAAKIEVVVLPQYRFELNSVEVPRYILAGNRYSATFALVNVGNLRLGVNLSARSSENYPVRLDSAVVTLGPREAKMIRVRVQTDESIVQKVTDNLEVRATFVADSAVAERSSATVQVIPQINKIDELYLKFPLQAKARAAGQDRNGGIQGELSGSGSFTEANTDRFDILVRSPNIQRQSLLGLRDEYRLRYWSDLYELRLGDWSYSLTPLTEQGRYAIGGEGRLSLHGLRVGGFYNETRWYLPKQKQAAGFGAYEILKGYEIGVNAIRKEERDTSTIVTARTTVRPTSQMLVDVEYGLSSRGSARGKAVNVQFAGRQDWMTYDLRYMRAGSAYTGYYRDLEYRSFSFNLYPFRQFRVEAYMRTEERNLARDTSFLVVPSDQFYQLGVGYSNVFSLSFRTSRQEDLFPNARYRRQEDIAELRIGQTFFSSLDLFANLGAGSVRDRLLGREFPSERYTLFSSFRIGSSQSYSASLEFSRDRNLFTAEKQERLSANLSSVIFFGPYTQLQVNLYGSRTVTSLVQSFVLVDATFEHEFPFGHRVAARVRQASFTPAFNGGELSYGVEYSIPLRIPLQRLSATGQLRGKVADESGKGMANVILSVGASAAMTDSRGEFFFPALPPEAAYLTVDKSSIGLDRMTIQQLPLEIIVKGGEELKLTINVVRSAKTFGTIVLYEFSPDDTSGQQLVQAGGRPGILVELSNGQEIQRRVSDSRGQFLFGDLRPGRWTVKVVGGDIPAFHYPEIESFDLNLPAGKEETVSFRLLPRKRTIKIIQEGDLLGPSLEGQAGVSTKPTEPLDCLISYDAKEKGYVLQVSSWVSRTKALLRAKVAELVSGKRSFIERVEIPTLGIRYRVFVGTFRTPQQAEETCKLLLPLEKE